MITTNERVEAQLQMFNLDSWGTFSSELTAHWRSNAESHGSLKLPVSIRCRHGTIAHLRWQNAIGNSNCAISLRSCQALWSAAFWFNDPLISHLYISLEPSECSINVGQSTNTNQHLMSTSWARFVRFWSRTSLSEATRHQTNQQFMMINSRFASALCHYGRIESVLLNVQPLANTNRVADGRQLVSDNIYLSITDDKAKSCRKWIGWPTTWKNIHLSFSRWARLALLVSLGPNYGRQWPTTFGIQATLARMSLPLKRRYKRRWH